MNIDCKRCGYPGGAYVTHVCKDATMTITSEGNKRPLVLYDAPESDAQDAQQTRSGSKQVAGEVSP